MSLLVAVAVSVAIVGAMTVAVSVRAGRAVASRERIEAMVADGVAGSRPAQRTIEESDRSAGIVQLVLPAGSLVCGWLAVVAVRIVVPDATPALTVFVVAATALVVVAFGDWIPRAAAAAAPERLMAVLGWPYRALAAVLSPIATVFGWVAAAVLLPVGMWLDGGRARAHSADELAELVGGLGDGGSIDRAGRRLLVGALGFLDVQVEDVMAPRDQIVTVPRTSTVVEAEQLLHRSGHSRVLVVGRDGEVTGFLHAKDLIALPPERRGGFLPAGLVRVALRVGPQDRLEEVLPRMRRARRHVAVVEDGGVVLGLVTLEDVLEAIVGDIHDESDLEVDEPHRTGTSEEDR